MPENVGYPKPKRKMPKEKMLARMSRADSLSSLSEFGSIVQPAAQDSVRKARKRGNSWNPFEIVGRALKRGK